MFLTNEKYFISNLSKTWENLRPVFQQKKRFKIMGKNKACENTTGSEKNHLAKQNQSSKVMISES